MAEARIHRNRSLHDPQAEGHTAAVEYFTAGGHRAVEQIPVGCGKTGLISILPLGVARGRVLVIAPNLTIRDQIAAAVDATNPGLVCSIVCRGGVMPEPVLRKSPLSTVVCEVRFDPSSIEQEQILTLARRLESAGLTEYRPEDGIQVAFQPGHVQQIAIKRHRFASTDGSTALSLDLGAFAFETATYGGFDGFLAAWEPVARAVGGALGLQARTRIGLRYINELQLASDGRDAVGKAVNADLLPPWGAEEHLMSLSSSLQELRFVQSEGELTFRHGLQRSGGGTPPIYLLDFDHYEQRLRGFDVGDEAERLRRFNATVYDVFYWSVTREQYKAFDPEERA